MQIFVKKQGFTLIELLVIVAIIALLSTVVLASLSNTRQKANDAMIKSDVSQIINVANLIYHEEGTFTRLCDSVTSLDITSAGGGSTNYQGQLAGLQSDITLRQGGTLNLNCNVSVSRYCIDVDLKATNAGRYCIDYTGLITATGESSLCDSGPDYDCK